jgi:bifunctional non-homologous end joining protein LigD
VAVDPPARCWGIRAVTAKARTRRRADVGKHTGAVRAGRRSVELTNAGKVLFPDDGVTKADLAQYYGSVAKWMLPHLHDRPIAMERYPDGIDGMRLFQKNASRHFPEWITRARVPKVGGTVEHVIVDQAATLVYLANQACITVHGFLSRLDELQNPDQLIFDLDPPGSEFALARRVALDLRGILENEVGLTSFVKTTGGDGLHVIVPLDRTADFDAVRAFAREVAAILVERDPKRVTVEQRVGARGKRLYVDVMRNAYAQTAVVPYTVRARRGATVAMPVSWDEVTDAQLRPDRYTIKNVPALLEQREDPWRGMKRPASTNPRSISGLAVD